MVSKVKLSKYSLVITIVIFLILITSIVFIDDNKTWYIVFSATVILLFFSFRFGPIKIIANDDHVTIKCVIRSHTIKMADIEGVELFYPTIGSLRICGSGGFMGYWGYFRDGVIGGYAAYYGKPSECFLVRMKNGDKYVLGCENPDEMVTFINSKIQSQECINGQ